MDGLRMTTRSEALQRVLEKEDCPYLLDCDIHITKNYFKRVCSSSNYLNCQHFARRVGELNQPMTWIQKIAVEEYVQEPQLDDQLRTNLDLYG